MLLLTHAKWIKSTKREHTPKHSIRSFPMACRSVTPAACVYYSNEMRQSPLSHHSHWQCTWCLGKLIHNFNYRTMQLITMMDKVESRVCICMCLCVHELGLSAKSQMPYKNVQWSETKWQNAIQSGVLAAASWAKMWCAFWGASSVSRCCRNVACAVRSPLHMIIMCYYSNLM